MPDWLMTGWILGQFGSRVGSAQERYRAFVRAGVTGPRPWDQGTGQIYLGGDAFVAQHQLGRRIHEIPRRQTQAEDATV